MKWFHKPKYKNVKIQDKKTLPTGVWIKCEKCEEVSLKKQLKKNYNVCSKCNFHFKITARERIDLLLDKGSFVEFNSHITADDPLNFSDAKGAYKTKVAEAIKKIKENEGVITGKGSINKLPIIFGVMEFKFLGGSMGSAVGEKIYQSMLTAVKKKCPLVIVSSSGGARMHEGLLSLMQMAKTCSGLQIMEDAGVPFISILADPTYGGITASFASMGDIIIAESGALIGFAGPRVIEQTIKQKLPEGFQTSEFLRDHGFVDIVADRRQLKEIISKILIFFQH